jgi:peptide deformylase
MILQLRTVPDPVLREKALPVGAVDKDVVRLMHDMLETMYHHRGVGLAAPQVGILKRVIVVDVEDPQDQTRAFLMADPVILSSSEEPFCYNEGCLSIPGQYAEVIRPKTIRMSYTNIDNKRVEIDASELLSTCIQHEIDHLDGGLFVDYLSKLKRDMMIRRVEKAKRFDVSEQNGHEL